MVPEDKKIHVVHIIPTLNFGGAEKFVVQLTKHVSTTHVRQSIITFWDSRPLLSELPEGVSCEVIPFPQISYARRVFVLAKRLKELRADIVHTHLFGADLWGRLSAWYAGIPVITTEHNINVSESKLWGVIKRLMRGMSRVYTAPSQAVALFMGRVYHIDPSHTKVIQHGIELDAFVSLASPRFETPYRIGIIGRIVEQKGHRVALDACTRLTHIPYELHITGDGELREELQQYASEIGISDRVFWHPSTTDVASVYAACDIVLVPSLWEGLGLVVLEAMASGRLVIASAVDGIQEITQDKKTAFLTPSNDASELAQRIEYAITHTDESRAIAQHGRKWVREHGDVGEMAEEYEELYLDLMGERGKGKGERVCLSSTEKQKILHIIPQFTTGGAERLVLHYARMLDKNKYDVAVANTVEDGELRKLFEKEHVILHVGSRTRDGGRIGVLRKLSQFIDEYEPDIIHTHLFGADLIGWLLFRIKKKHFRWISTQHNVEYTTSLLRRMIWKFILKDASAIIAVADKVKKYIVEEFKLGNKKIHVIKNGIELETWLSVEPKVMQQKTLQLAIIGRLEEQKGHRYLFEALHKLRRVDWQLHVYGEGSLKTTLERLAVKYEIDSRITWQGVNQTLHNVYRDIDIVVQPSLWEGLSLVVMEAMAAGKTMIVSKPAGEELVEDTRTGLLTAPGDAGSIVSALEFCMAHTQAAQDMGNQARIYAAQHFDIRNNVIHVEQLYEDILK